MITVSFAIKSIINSDVADEWAALLCFVFVRYGIQISVARSPIRRDVSCGLPETLQENYSIIP
jgi:hypothetical protein